ncbi:PA2169 family four-helix-bundle protein [soil metagenome]
MDTQKKSVDKLNELLEKNYDAEQGYRNAAEDTNNSLIKKFLLDHSKERYDFGHQLKDEITKLGGKPDKGTSLTADIHRKWMDLKTAIAGNSDKAVIEECERGERAALQDYKEVLEEGLLPESAGNIVQSQYEKIKSALARLENLETVL